MTVANRKLRWSVPAAYLGLAIAFVALYLRSTASWTDADFRAYCTGALHYPNALDSFRYRVLVPAIGGFLIRATGAKPVLLFQGLAALSTWGLLLGYRATLGHLTDSRRAALLAPLLLYPTIWNYCLLNRLYFPFDLPAIWLMVSGWRALWDRAWRTFYLVLVLSALNRESSIILVFIFVTTQWRELPRASFFAHLTAMIALWSGVLVATRWALGGLPDLARNDWLGGNLRTIADMLRWRGNALKDWAKLVLCFGGMAWVIPAVWRRQDPFVRRSLWAIVPFVLGIARRGIVDEVRVYGDLIPLVATPAIATLAASLDSRSPRADQGIAAGGGS